MRAQDSPSRAQIGRCKIRTRTEIRAPGRVVQSFSAWKLPYHLWTWLIFIMTSRYRMTAMRACRRRTPNDATQEMVK